ncbi:MAG: N-6 DNA methylase [Pseudomonadota bacterium]|jgi:hypothetical protein|nr:MAG: hypothetical protein DIU62_10990 [Pseudomonadota bacterium]
MSNFLEAHAYLVRNSALHPHDAALLVTRLAVWVHLTASFELPPLLRADPGGWPLTSKELESIFLELLENPIPEAARCVLETGVPSEHADLSEKQLGTLLRHVWRTARWGNTFSSTGFEAFLAKVWSVAPNREVIPALSVADLLVQLADCPANQPLTCLGDGAQSVAIAAMKRSQPVILWTEDVPVWASAYAVLSGSHLTLRRCAFPAPESELTGDSGIGIAVPPFGLNLRGNTRHRSTPGYVRYMTAYRQAARKRLVCVTPNRALFASGEEAALRQDLVNRGELAAVVSFPPGLLTGTSVPFAVLLVEPGCGERQIRVLNVDETVHVDQVGLARRRHRSLTDSPALVELIRRPVRPFGRVVPIEEIARHDFILTPGRYLHEPESGWTRGATPQCMHVRLTDLVTILRPQALPPPTCGAPVLVAEMGASDLSRSDYSSPAGRERATDAHALEKRKDHLLKPGDVLLAVKGDTGATGIFGGDGRPCVASQSLLVLRMHTDPRGRPGPGKALIDPAVLLMLLRSPPVQAYLRSVTSVSTVPVIRAQDVERMRVPLFPIAQQKQLLELFHELCRLNREIVALERKRFEVEACFWESGGWTGEAGRAQDRT